METGIWSAKEYLQYTTMTLYHSIINSEEERIVKNTANFLQQSRFNQQRDKSRYKSSRKTQEVSMEEIDQAEDQGKYTKKTVG